jgi:hypothetical protein
MVLVDLPEGGDTARALAQGLAGRGFACVVLLVDTENGAARRQRGPRGSFVVPRPLSTFDVHWIEEQCRG